MRALAGCLLLAFSFSIFGQPTKPVPTWIKQNEVRQPSVEKINEKNSAPNKSTPKIIAANETESSAPVDVAMPPHKNEEKSSAEWEQVKVAKFAAVIAVLVLLTAMIQAGMFSWQLNLMRYANSTAAHSAEAAEKSAQASLNQSIHLQQSTRAYVLASNKFGMDHNFGQVRGTVLFKNFGQTPASDVRVCIFINFVELPFSGPFNQGDFSGASKAPIGPGLEFPLTAELPAPLREENKQKCLSGAAAIIVWGEVQYKDIFGVAQLTKIKIQSTGDDFDKGLFEICEDGNEAT